MRRSTYNQLIETLEPMELTMRRTINHLKNTLKSSVALALLSLLAAAACAPAPVNQARTDWTGLLGDHYNHRMLVNDIE